MKLLYYHEELNFGDALNEFIFKHYIPELIDNNQAEVLMGIGTILGLIHPDSKHKKIFVFSSGCGYGTLPVIDHRYDFLCVRGPLTAEKLNLNMDLAITDGAVLLKGMPIEKPGKVYKWSFIPHWQSETLFDKWEILVKKAGGNFISPINNPGFVIEEILKSEKVVAEAMHGAIVADTLRVPWVPVKSYKHINDFKWRDWLIGIHMQYHPITLPSVFGKLRIKKIIEKKWPVLRKTFLSDGVASLYYLWQCYIIERSIIRKFRIISKMSYFLSDSEILEKKYFQLFEKLEELKRKSQSKTG